MNNSNVETFQQLDMLDNAIVRLKHSICDIEDLKKTGTTKTKSILKDFDEYHFLAIKDWCDTIDEEIQEASSKTNDKKSGRPKKA